jgi:carbon starvation protein
MNSIPIVLLAFAAFFIAFRFYSKFLADKVFSISYDKPTPSVTRYDGVDFVPTNRFVLFGHHFASIAGLAPMLGPAIGVMWGWLPALIWVVAGSIFMGAVHDLGSLSLSLKHDGRTIGDLTREILGARAQILFQIVIFFLLALAMGVFAYIVGRLFVLRPESVIPSFALIAIAMGSGAVMYKGGSGIVKPTLVGVALMFFTIWLGMRYPVTGISPDVWIYILLAYSYVASVLPVWILLQPRDYLNSFEFFIALGLTYAGLFVLRPEVVAPAVALDSPGVPSLFPFLFITIACGAISGFHSVVASGTTARQIASRKDARLIGYGPMLGEAVVAVMAIVACTAGLGSLEAWRAHYASWEVAAGLAPKLNAFVKGSGLFISQLGIPRDFAETFVSVVVVAFALTTLDSATRLLRFTISDLGTAGRFEPARGRSGNMKPAFSQLLSNRYFSSFLAIVAIGFFALLRVNGEPAGLALWQLFGTTNQLLAGLALLLITVYLLSKGKRIIYTLIPMAFMLVVTLWAMVAKISEFLNAKSWTLLVVGTILFVIALWLAGEAVSSIRSERRRLGRAR